MDQAKRRKSWTGDGKEHGQEFLVGHHYADYEMIEDRIRIGSRITLKRHSTNMHDPHAITCWFPHPELGQVRIGFLDRATAWRLAPHMDKGVKLDAVVEYFGRDVAVRIRKTRTPKQA